MIPRPMWKRLGDVAKPSKPRNIQRPFVFLSEGETRQDLEGKIERWKAGEKVDGISAEYEGGEIEIRRAFAFANPKG